MAASGDPAGLEVNSFVSSLAPKGVSAAVQAKIEADIAEVAADALIARQGASRSRTQDSPSMR